MGNYEVGIDAISVYIPPYYLELKDLALANRTDPDHYLVGLGCRRMALAPPGEDPVTMAAEALETLFERYAVSKGEIGMLLVGTESSVDEAKPVASIVHGLLGLPSRCRTLDVKHACYGATGALRLACDYVEKTARGALVVATDIALYDIGSPGEPTQGAGAVAILVRKNPKILTFEPFVEAVYTRHVWDFFRPPHRQSAIVDGHFSVQCYLEALEASYLFFREATGRSFLDFQYLLFHIPFPKMAKKALARLHQVEARFSEVPCSLEEDFERRVEPALYANAEVGNIYCGSLYLSLCGLLERAQDSDASALLGLFSYGSGSCAEFFCGRLGPDPNAWLGQTGLLEALKDRKRVTYEDYVAWREAREGEIGGKRFRFKGLDKGRRLYTSPKRDESRS